MVGEPQLYLIPFLHQTTTSVQFGLTRHCCILFLFYIKPQRHGVKVLAFNRCILFLFYIKPQLHPQTNKNETVVSYSFSTSNHNSVFDLPCLARVVSYSFSTSNHNLICLDIVLLRLYLIPFLHQTTT